MISFHWLDKFKKMKLEKKIPEKRKTKEEIWKEKSHVVSLTETWINGGESLL